MRNLYILLAFCLSTITIQAQQTNWETISSEELGFKIDFPKAPTENNELVTTDIGLIDTKTFVTELADNDSKGIYLFSRSIYPELITHSSVIEKDRLYQQKIEALANEMNGRIVSYKSVNLNDDTRGKMGSILLKDSNLRLDFKFFLVENIMYNIKTVHPTNMNHDIKNDFFSSFEVIAMEN